MKTFQGVEAIQDYCVQQRKANKRIGLVPTMGALHQGHLDLITSLINEVDIIIVSIFVNPTQFGPKEDFSTYPRSLQSDLESCAKLGVSAVFHPSSDDIYPKGYNTHVSIGPLAKCFCGKTRPQFFDGVTNVVLRLFNIIQPQVAIFGEKDYQQLVIIKTLVKDLFLPITIKALPTVRQISGLALSSRNHYLSATQLKQAASIYHSCLEAQKLVRRKQNVKAALLKKHLQSFLADSITVDYIEFVDPISLDIVDIVSTGHRVLIAAMLGHTRLIDNLAL